MTTPAARAHEHQPATARELEQANQDTIAAAIATCDHFATQPRRPAVNTKAWARAARWLATGRDRVDAAHVANTINARITAAASTDCHPALFALWLATSPVAPGATRPLTIDDVATYALANGEYCAYLTTGWSWIQARNTQRNRDIDLHADPYTGHVTYHPLRPMSPAHAAVYDALRAGGMTITEAVATATDVTTTCAHARSPSTPGALVLR